MTAYWRPLTQVGPRPPGALPVAGGPCWFERVEKLDRNVQGRFLSASDVPGDVLDRLTAPRADWAGLALDRVRLMGILNVTPDSFSDGGQFFDRAAALAQAARMKADGADLIDLGGESTRPGAAELFNEEESARVLPVIEALAGGGPLSIDTRKAGVARLSVAAGAVAVNDVSALRHDPAMAPFLAEAGLPVVLMHAQGTPETMQDAPRYDHVLLDVYDALAERVAFAEAAGIARDRIMVDPGIGFGKTVEHNVALIRGLSLFHGLGCPLLLGASRKGFIGRIAAVSDPVNRVPGSVAVALAAAAQGVHMLRVHDIAATRQALHLWEAVNLEE